jgi:sec-independent protein translocase protein TatB
MFNVGLAEILVVALVGVIAIDKEKVPMFIDFIKIVYRYILKIRLKAKELLKDAGIEDLYTGEEVNYITGKDGRLYPTYNVENHDNDSKNSSSR